MTIEEFRKHMGRLSEQYGDKVYSTERALGIWENVKHLTEREWDKTVGDLIASCQHPPLLQKIKEATNHFLERVRIAKQKEIEALKMREPKCKQCGNTGSINAWEIGTPYSCVFRCDCSVADLIGNNWPVWKEFHRSKYMPQFFDDANSDHHFRPPTNEEVEILKSAFQNMPGYMPMLKSERDRTVEHSKFLAAGDRFNFD